VEGHARKGIRVTLKHHGLLMAAAANPGTIVLQLDGAGSNGSTTILDTSPAARTMTAVGNAQISTAQFVYGSSSIAFDGSDDQVTAASSSDWDFGSGDFCMEVFVRPRSNTGDFQSMIARASSSANADNGFFFRYSNTGWSAALFHGSTIESVTYAPGFPGSNIWKHAAFVREGTLLRIYVDGVQGAVSSAMAGGTTMNNPTAALVLGTRGYDAGHDLHAYLHARITKGWARYLGGTTFTPPTSF
jgi:hypothetical protein